MINCILLTSNKVLLRSCCLSNRLLAKSTFPRNYWWSFHHVLGNELNHVSPMFIPEHQCKCGTQNKCLQILFFNSLNRSFCNSKNLFNCKCILFPEAWITLWGNLRVTSYSCPRVSVNQCKWPMGENRGKGSLKVSIKRSCKIIFLKRRCYRPTERWSPLELLQQSISGRGSTDWPSLMATTL